MIRQSPLRVTAVEIEFPAAKGSPKFLAYAVVTLEHMLVIRSMRLIKLDDGRIIVAMPNRKRTQVCQGCKAVVPLDFDYCGQCRDMLPYIDDGDRLTVDVVFPACAAQRAAIEAAVLREYDRRTSERAAAEWELTRALVRGVA